MPADFERGYTGHGPHRDELAIVREGRELRVFGSQGEQRLALLALLLAERAALEQERRRTPLMLLDDVMSELDSERRDRLAEGMKVLDTRERLIIQARHLRQRPATLASLGQRFGISRERVRQLELRAKTKLQRYCVNEGRVEG